jgi:hypothetical protein
MITINQTKQSLIEKTLRIDELKTLLLNSDYRMTLDYYEQMSAEDQGKWTNDRNLWRTELRRLENA